MESTDKTNSPGEGAKENAGDQTGAGGDKPPVNPPPTNTPPPPVAAPKVKGKPVALPVVPKQTSADSIAAKFPKADDFTAIYVREADGLDYAVAVHEADLYGFTHTCKNSENTWQGTKEQFRAQFEKK